VKEGVPGFMAALYLYVKTGTSVQVYDLLAFWGGRRDQNIPHRPAYPAGSAGYITLDIHGAGSINFTTGSLVLPFDEGASGGRGCASEGALLFSLSGFRWRENNPYRSINTCSLFLL